MIKMTGHPRLYRRGATYYHRAAIPVDIKDTYPKAEETFTLDTKNRAEAVRLVRVEAARVDRLFDKHRNDLLDQSKPPLKELSEEQIKRIGDIYYAAQLEEDEIIRRLGFHEDGEPDALPHSVTFENYEEATHSFDKGVRRSQARGKIDGFYHEQALEVLTWSNVNLRVSESSESLVSLARTLQAAAIKAAKVTQQRNDGDIIETPSEPNVIKSATAPLLSVAVEEWASERARSRWVKKTEYEHRTWMAHFISITGDKPLTDYGKADGRGFKQVLLNLPANWSKLSAIKGLSIKDAAEKAKAIGLPPMSESNCNKLIGFVSAFWTWADANYDDVPSNPLRGLKVKKSKQARDERDPFTANELGVIFAAPIFTGCDSVRRWKTPGDFIPRTSGLYWVPLISLFTGGRLGEIIQMYTDDIREEFGVRYFDFNIDGDDKRLNVNAGVKTHQ